MLKAFTPTPAHWPRHWAPFAMMTLAFMGFLSSDMYLTLMPAMTLALHSNAHWMQFSVASYFMGLVVAQLVMGPLSDAIGRRPIVLFGLFNMVVGNVLCGIAHGMPLFLLARLISGVGAAGGLTLARTITRDCFAREDLAKMASWFSLVVGIAPAVAPALGGLVGAHWGWQLIFEAMAVLYLLLLGVYALFFPETLPSQMPYRGRVLKANLKALLALQPFVGACLLAPLVFSAYMAYMTAAPFIFQVGFHFTVRQYVMVVVSIAIGNVAGKMLNIVLLRHLRALQILRFATVLLCLSAAGTVLQTWLWCTPGLIMVWMLLQVVAFAVITPNLFSTGLGSASVSVAGMAGALYGTAQMGGAFLGSALMALTAAFGLSALAIFWLVVALMVFWLARVMLPAN